MESGKLNKLIDFEKKTKVSDGMGGRTVVWATHKSDVWASIWPVSSKETLQAMSDKLAATHRIRVRFRSDITHSMRIKYGTKYFNIVSIINPNTGNRMLEFLAMEVF